MVRSPSPLTRSSYHADADFQQLRAQVSRSEPKASEAQQEGGAPSPGAL
jgi:hypothetical protein